MSYEIPVPYRDRDQPLVDARADLGAASLSPADRDVAREVLSDALIEDGLETVGELFDHLEDPAERLATLNRARAKLGLPDVETAKSREHLERINRAMRPGRDADGRRVTQCAEPECARMPTGPGGTPRPVADRRWWCAAHKHLAGEDDHLPPEPRYVIDAGFGVRPVGAERERLEREDAKRREEQEERNERRKREAAAIKAARERYLQRDDLTPIAGNIHPRNVRMNP